MPQTNELTMQVNSKNPIEFKAKKEALQKLARVDIDVLEKLAELSNSEKAKNSLRKNWGMVKTMFG